jgi:WD40 repeat protein
MKTHWQALVADLAAGAVLVLLIIDPTRGRTGALAVIGGNTLLLRDLASGKELHRLQHPGSGHFAAVAFAPDGQTVLVGETRLFDRDFEGLASLWDVVTGKELRLFRGQRHTVISIAFAPDGKTLATGSEDKTLRLWDTATGKELRRLRSGWSGPGLGER